MLEEAWRAAAARYRDMVWRVACNACSHRQDAEDITQDVFLKLYATRRTFADDDHLKRWLLRVTLNACKSRWRSPWHARRADPETLPEPAAPDPGPDRDAALALLDAMRALPEQSRVVIYLYYYEDLPTAEIAKLLGIRQTAVTTRLQRAREALRAALADWE